MNKYDLREHLRRMIHEFCSSFRATSYDSVNDEYLCADETTKDVYDFDKYVSENYPSEQPASPDAIYIGKKDLYFVEFKNQRVCDIKSDKIRKKFKNGTEILKKMLASFPPKDCKYYFCVVFKPDSKPKYFSSQYIESNVVRFGLEEENDKFREFYDQIITRDVGFFKEEFRQLSCR